MMLRREEGREEKALDAFENHRNIKKDQERHEFWGLSITVARFWFAGTISRELHSSDVKHCAAMYSR